ncbi:monooxygenase [Saitoella coloradoensis]
MVDPRRARRVAIIGAGASGLTAARAFIAEGISNIRIFERRSEIGGSWIYTDETPNPSPVPRVNPQEEDEPLRKDGVPVWPSPMYKYLHTNIPAQKLMEFSDLRFPPDTETFPHRSVVLEYLRTYSAQVKDLIELQTAVEDIRKDSDESGEWVVKLRKVVGDERTWEERFDAVCVATGHFEVPTIPLVKGISTFPKPITHAKSFRTPHQFTNQKVLVVGNGPSGLDISEEIVRDAQQPVWRSVRSESKMPVIPHPDVEDVPPIEEYREDGVIVLEGGKVLEGVDVVLYATGYYYSLPFMPSLCEGPDALITDGLRIRRLYRQVFYAYDPTLTFLGLPWQVIPFPNSEAQAMIVARFYAGRLSMPSAEEMLQAEQDEISEKGDGRNFHKMGHPRDGEYINMLRSWALEAAGEGGLMIPEWSEEKFNVRAELGKWKAKYIEEHRDRPLN